VTEGAARDFFTRGRLFMFARYFVESFEMGQTSELPAAFAAIEKILNEGDLESRNIAEIGQLSPGG
jgi:hypothetical protein